MMNLKENETSIDQFLAHANDICSVTNKETGLNFSVEQVNGKHLFDIIEGNRCVVQSNDQGYIIGYLCGMQRIFRMFQKSNCCPLKIIKKTSEKRKQWLRTIEFMNTTARGNNG